LANIIDLNELADELNLEINIVRPSDVLKEWVVENKEIVFVGLGVFAVLLMWKKL
jgi:hypothetical protein